MKFIDVNVFSCFCPYGGSNVPLNVYRFPFPINLNFLKYVWGFSFQTQLSEFIDLNLLNIFLGTVPGPVIFGAVTDTACLVWQTECGEHSSCWIYDNFAVSRNYFLIAISAKIVSIFFFSVAFCTYKPPKGGDENEFGVVLHPRESERRNMSFVNGSFRESEFEATVTREPPRTKKTEVGANKTTDL